MPLTGTIMCLYMYMCVHVGCIYNHDIHAHVRCICRPALVYGKYQLAEYISVNLIELIEVTHSVMYMYMHVLAASWTVMWEYAGLAHVNERKVSVPACIVMLLHGCL